MKYTTEDAKAHNAVIYARYSSHGQRDESIEDQVRVCREEAERNGDTVLRVYADKAITGTSVEKRVAFAEMISDSSKGLFTKVYVYKTDRFARNRYDSAVYKAKLKKNGVRVVSATEHIQDGPDGILLEAVLEGMAEYFSANLSENVQRGLHGNALNCKHNGIKLFGYDSEADGFFHVNKEEAAVVRTVFNMYDSGSSMPEIIEAFPTQRTKRGSKWRVSYLAKMLRTEQYAGVYIYGGVRIEGGMPAIISRELFDSVQARLKIRKRKRRGIVNYLLSGKLFDFDGNSYASTSGHGKSGRKYTYYRCAETGHSVSQEGMEDEVAAAVAEALSAEGITDMVTEIILAAQDEAMEDDVAAIEAMRKRLADNEREQERLVTLASKGGNLDVAARKLNELADEAAELSAELAEMERGCPVITADHIEFWMRDMISRKNPEEVVDVFVSRVFIDPKGERPMQVELSINNKEKPSSSEELKGSSKSPMVGAKGLEPLSLAAADFKSAASANSATLPCV